MTAPAQRLGVAAAERRCAEWEWEDGAVALEEEEDGGGEETAENEG